MIKAPFRFSSYRKLPTMTGTITKYSLEEVSKRDGSNGSRIWIVIKDKVIDVTDQLDQHPGGREVIMEYAGKDATKAFNNVGHSSDAQSYVKGATIGELIEEDKAANKTKKNEPAQGSKTTSSERSFLSIISCGICT